MDLRALEHVEQLRALKSLELRMLESACQHVGQPFTPRSPRIRAMSPRQPGSEPRLSSARLPPRAPPRVLLGISGNSLSSDVFQGSAWLFVERGTCMALRSTISKTETLRYCMALESTNTLPQSLDERLLATASTT